MLDKYTKQLAELCPKTCKNDVDDHKMVDKAELIKRIMLDVDGKCILKYSVLDFKLRVRARIRLFRLLYVFGARWSEFRRHVRSYTL
jgi:hypothetical protein